MTNEKGLPKGQSMNEQTDRATIGAIRLALATTGDDAKKLSVIHELIASAPPTPNGAAHNEEAVNLLSAAIGWAGAEELVMSGG